MSRSSDALLKEVRRIVASLPPPPPGPLDAYIEGLSDEDRATVYAIHDQVGGGNFVQFLRNCDDSQYQTVRSIYAQSAMI